MALPALAAAIMIEPEDPRRMTLVRFRYLEAALRARGYGDMIAWSEALQPPADADAFARAVIYVICNSGMNFTIAGKIYARCLDALSRGGSATTVFGHPGKAAAIDQVWRQRDALFAAFSEVDDRLAFCGTLPWVGPVTKHHLAKNLGVNTVKPDVHLARLAAAEGITAWELCRRLATETGYREATIDTILWKACADGVIDSRRYTASGWDAAVAVDTGGTSDKTV